MRLYPVGPPIRDAAHVALLSRLRGLVAPAFRWRYEVALPISGDGRAFDAVLELGPLRIGVATESRLRDIQALRGREQLKRRDAGVDPAGDGYLVL